MYYVFLDESGDVAPFSGSHFLVVALLGMQNTRAIELHVKRTFKRHGTALGSGEMKASASREKVIERLLKAIAGEPVSIVAVVVNKRERVQPLRDTESLYRWAAAQAIRRVVAQYPRVDICLDKRYTNKSLRYDLEREIREGIADLPQEVVIIRQEDSIGEKALQAVDHVAWAFFQKYEHGEERFYRLLTERIIVEEVLEYP